nr:macro domain-containing protein [uncultured Desulfobulbus sp.]
MIRYVKGNLLKSKVEALVNTVNTVGVMGKGIALMFKEAFPDNFIHYERACKEERVQVGNLFIHENVKLFGPKWIVNFPTKKHWRNRAKVEWVTAGLKELRKFILENQVKSIAIPPLGCGNGGLDWQLVRKEIENNLSDISGVEILVFEPTRKYQNVAKKSGVEKLTPARALIAEIIRQYWVLGIECSLLEIQKLAWFLERSVNEFAEDNPLDLRFEANKFGPYANRLNHLLNSLDGSYLHCNKRIADAGPMEVIWFDDKKKDMLHLYLNGGEVKPYIKALKHTLGVIDGFESPLGMELLATVDWLIHKEKCVATIDGIKECLTKWPGGQEAARRKSKLFNDRLINLALSRLASVQNVCQAT